MPSNDQKWNPVQNGGDVTYSLLRDASRLRTPRYQKGKRSKSKHQGPVAQWSEQGTHNPLVVGSIPTGPTGF